MQIQSMTLASLTLQIRRHEHSRYLNIVIFVGICTLPFYAINMDVAHPWVSESEREKICGLLDCQKLTLEACTHAAQNESLPLRAVVQVLFFKQLQLRHAIAETLIAADTDVAEISRHSAALKREEEDGGGEMLRLGLETEHVQEGNNTWRVAVKENQVLRLDMDNMRTRVHQLEQECSSMKKVIENPLPRRAVDGGRRWGRSLGVNLKLRFVIRINQRLLICVRNNIVARSSITLVMNKHHA